MNAVTIAVKRLAHGAALPLPSYESEGCAGMDIAAAVAAPVAVAPGERVLIPTGLVIGLPEGYEAQIRPRSGLALKHGITLVNTPGTIDADYRGEIGIILINHGDAPFTIEPGMRIAQMVIAPVTRASWREMDEVPSTARGDGGFGSTGVASRQA